MQDAGYRAHPPGGASSFVEYESKRFAEFGRGSAWKRVSGSGEHPEIDLVSGRFEIGSRQSNLVHRSVA